MSLQDHFERLIADYTTPYIDVQYRMLDYRLGAVGVLEVLRDATKLPYTVRKSIMGAKARRLIIKGQCFVRHGSQAEKPTREELRLLLEEGERARAAVRSQ